MSGHSPARTGPWTVSLCLDMNGIEADTPLHALQLAREALTLGVPVIATSVDFGCVGHVMGAVGSYLEFDLKTEKQIRNHHDEPAPKHD